MMVAAPRISPRLIMSLCLRDGHPAHRLGLINLRLSDQIGVAGHIDILGRVR